MMQSEVIIPVIEGEERRPRRVGDLMPKRNPGDHDARQHTKTLWFLVKELPHTPIDQRMQKNILARRADHNAAEAHLKVLMKQRGKLNRKLALKLKPETRQRIAVEKAAIDSQIPAARTEVLRTNKAMDPSDWDDHTFPELT